MASRTNANPRSLVSAPVRVEVSPRAAPPGFEDGARDEAAPAPEFLGAGRSGRVFKRADAEGRVIADKVFGSNGLTRLVQYALLGAPNPYAWSEDAIICAELRRNIVARLVRFWFEGEVEVADAYGRSWNTEQRSWSLQTRFIDGRAPALDHPTNREGREEVRELVERVMRPLQRHLAKAGLDGSVWQAGLGNPVALANFLRVNDGGSVRWVWIDLESGVPALFPASPVQLFRFYIPRSVRWRRPLFDDINVERLRMYVKREQSALVERNGLEAYEDLLADIAIISRHAEGWQQLRRHQRSLRAREAAGQVSASLVRRYWNRPIRWYTREAGRAPGVLSSAATRVAGDVWRRVRDFPWRRLPADAMRFLVSQSFRYDSSARLVSQRIESWERRGQLRRVEADRLHAQLAHEESGAYITDFGVHVAIKPIVKFSQFAVAPALFAGGLIGPTAFAVILVGGGGIARTLYTLGRVVQCSLIGHERPWVALGVGTAPVVGNLAFPLQFVYSSTVDDDRIARFLVYDGCTTMGRRLPIWGGRDTLTEHIFNRAPERVLGLLGRRRRKR